MNTDTLGEAVDAPERYELEAEPFPHDLPLRVDLFGLYGAGLVVLAGPAPSETEATTFDVWLHLGETGRVTVCAGKAEVGQNAHTSLAQAAADELRVPVETVQTVLGDTGRTPFDMGTFGSRTTPYTIPPVRRAAAAARELLIDLVAEQWHIKRDALTVDGGQVIWAGTSQAFDFGGLVRGQKLVRTVGPEVATMAAERWTVAGTSAPKAGGRAFVTGRHQFTSDLAVAGMLYGKVLHPPAFKAVLKFVETRAAEAMPGVTVVHDGDFVAVAASTVAEAERALAAIEAEWERPLAPAGQDLVALLRPQAPIFDVPSGADDAAHRLGATYTLAYIAHVPLEPRAALAQWDGDQLTVWTGTQRPFGVREELSVVFGLPDSRIRVIVPDTGSGYGGKHTGDAAIEAARLARAAGRPVKLVWTREEEFACAYCRPGGVIDVAAATRADGTLVDWECHNTNSGAAGIRSPYDIPDQRTEFHEADSPLRQGSYRALAATGNHFARECHMDDLAHAHGLDPLAFRLANLKDDRLRAVLEAAAERFGWAERQAAPGRGFGIAGGTEKGSYIANCVEVDVDPANGQMAIQRIVAAYECGAVINPMHLENQVEGAIVMGIGGALFEAIEFDGGRVLNPRLSEYRVPRFGDVPEIAVVLLDRKDLPSVGAGETPIVAIAPALGNALFDATGVRLRGLPFRTGGLKEAP